ncbi:hypothetical protein [Bradyrhizobium sp. STM 3809]|uniref:hypothetical protein n=1 Tax=Bradyrhizobium sp. STM 3809 TaxID=551936 RepID=UPI001F0A4AE4|nr:hypothetical protein [Bradyrhizobium sp. STM 3809]
MPFEQLGRHADRFAERRMRMDGLADIDRLATRLDAEPDRTDPIAGRGSDDAAADDAVGRRIKQQLGKALVAAIGDHAARGCPWEYRLAEPDALGVSPRGRP